MGVPSTPSPQLYPQALQIKLYQAFIFSFPVLFSVILVLLFYLFYLKRRASNLSSSPTLPWRLNQAIPEPFGMDMKEGFKDKLPIVEYDEDVKPKDSQFRGQGAITLDSLLQACVSHRLYSSLASSKHHVSTLSLLRPISSKPLSQFNLLQQVDANPNHHLQLGSERELVSPSWNFTNFPSAEDHSREIEGSRSGTSCLTEPSDSN